MLEIAIVIRLIRAESVSAKKGKRQGHLASVCHSLQDPEDLWGHMGESVGRAWGRTKRRQVQP